MSPAEEYPVLDWTRLRPPNSVAALVGLGVDLGVEVATLLRGSGLTREALDHGDTQVSGVQEVEVVRNLQAARPDIEYLGILAGKRYPLTYYGMLGLAWVSSATLADSLVLTERYQHLAYGMLDASTPAVVDGWFGTVLTPGTLPSDVKDFHVQAGVSMLVTTAREILGEQGFQTQARFTQPAPTSPAARDAFLEILGMPPEFGAREDWVAYRVELLATPLPRAAPHTLQMALAKIEEQLASALERDTVIGQVTSRILTHLRAGAPIDAVARDLSVSSRTLRRRLQAEGTSYRNLLETVRAREAENLLRQTDLSVAQVATRLGYANPPAFSAAFRRWHRISPLAFRHLTAA